MNANVISLRRTAAAISRALPDIGEGLAAKLANLARDPSPWACEETACALDGARRECLLLADALKRESDHSAA